MMRQRGFSLLELLVAFSIMAISLVMLYRVSASSARHVVDAERYQRAVVLADSLLASTETVDEKGWNDAGEVAGFSWMVRSVPYLTPIANADPKALPLHEIALTVRWREGAQAREIAVTTLRVQRKPIQAGVAK